MESIAVAIMEFVLTWAPWLAPLILTVPWLACIPCWAVGLPLVGSMFTWIFVKLGISIACKVRRK